MKVSIKNNAQGGFTLIELIVVIVILGILAATALPKFASMGGDARVASMNAARGSLSATAAMAHAKFLANPSMGTSLAMEDVSVTLLANGYPSAIDTTARAAGLTADDYTVYPAGTTGAKKPAVPAGSIGIVPISLVNTVSAENCWVEYAATATAPPTVTVHGTADTCN